MYISLINTRYILINTVFYHIFMVYKKCVTKNLNTISNIINKPLNNNISSLQKAQFYWIIFNWWSVLASFKGFKVR